MKKRFLTFIFVVISIQMMNATDCKVRVNLSSKNAHSICSNACNMGYAWNGQWSCSRGVDTKFPCVCGCKYANWRAYFYSPCK